jgi:hypothetical protein
MPVDGTIDIFDIALHDTYVVWGPGLVGLLHVVVLVLAAAALIKYLFFR